MRGVNVSEDTETQEEAESRFARVDTRRFWEESYQTGMILAMQRVPGNSLSSISEEARLLADAAVRNRAAFMASHECK